MSKFGNKKIKDDGYTFDSLGEHRRYLQLRLLARQGIIRDLEVHPRWVLFQKDKDAEGKLIRQVTYAADFMYREDGVVVVEDVKGHQTEAFKLKWNLFRRHIAAIERAERTRYRLVILPLKDV